MYLEHDGHAILVDTTPDFRTQALRYDVRRVDAVLMTHTHADHIFGFDDLRRFNTLQGERIPVYGGERTIARLQEIFDYVKPDKPRPGFFTPQIGFEVRTEAFEIGAVQVRPHEVEHGSVETYGFELEVDGRRLGYFPDVKRMSDDVVESLVGVDIMVLDALRPDREHPSHIVLEETLSYLDRIKPKAAYLIHMCHDFEHAELEASLPAGVFAAYDGLVLELGNGMDGG